MKQEVTYNNTTVLVNSYQPRVQLQWATPSPSQIVTTACSTTQKGVFAKTMPPNGSKPLIQYLIQANHTSPLEHAVISFHISHISRATLDQLVRHRIGSFTASSTHYQDHANYSHYVDVLSFSIPEFLMQIAKAMDMYKEVVERDTQTARQILPLSVEVAVHWTVNARSLFNFLNLRLCRRNTVEMILLAQEICSEAIIWFPDCFDTDIIDCETSKGCTQGQMACNAASAYRINSNIAAWDE